MSNHSELHDNHPVDTSLLAFEQLQSLHNSSEAPITGEVQYDLHLAPYDQILPLNRVPASTHIATLQLNRRGPNYWNKRDDEIIRALCNNQQDAKLGWEKLRDHRSMVQQGSFVMPWPAEKELHHNLCVVPPSWDDGTVAVNQHPGHDCDFERKILAHVAEPGQIQRLGMIGTSVSGHSCPQQQYPQPGAQARLYHRPVEERTLALHSTGSDPTRPNGSVDQQVVLAPRRLASNTPSQYPQPHILPGEQRMHHDISKPNPASDSFVSPTVNSYQFPRIHFPNLSYVIDKRVFADNCSKHDLSPDHKHQDMQQRGTLNSHSQRFTPSLARDPIPPPPPPPSSRTQTPISKTSINALAPYAPPMYPDPTLLTPKLPNEPRTPFLSQKSPRTSINQPLSNPHKPVVDSTGPKKLHTQTRRWSRTYLNQLMRQQRPRNLPEDMRLTDDQNVQEIPLWRLIPELTTVDAENRGRTVLFSAGTRVEGPKDARKAGGVPWTGEYFGLGETLPVMLVTPFRLVVLDGQGRVSIAMSWTSDVAASDPVGMAEQCDWEGVRSKSNGYTRGLHVGPHR